MSSFNWGDMLVKIGLAIVIILVTWLIAWLVKWGISKLVGRIGFLQKQGSDGKPVGDSIGQVASLLVWLFGLVAVLQVFALEQVLAPIQSMLDGILQYLPNIIGAGFIFFIGFVIAKIVSQLVSVALNAANLDRLMRKASPQRAADTITGEEAAPPPQEASPDQPSQPSAGTRIASIASNLVFAVILIVVAVAALQILNITAISEPAVQMLNLILGAIPSIIAALLILGLGYLIAKFVGDLLEGTLVGIGTDRAIASVGVVPEGRSASAIITAIARVAIMVFFGIMAARALNFPEITGILNEVLSLGGRVLFGGAIIAAGFLVAKLLSNAIGSGTASTVIRYATLVLFAAMGLQYMGIADSIITLAFGSIVVGGALAAALAFGLGGRDAAARSLDRLGEKAEKKDSTPTA
ncbi:mechanosensitive ion channel [Microbacterium halotolerans]|uniref:mechanosensitive ion channel n=1 Tax=Microbacterium halotolerans TaxID=246613 RepID=UPI001F09CA27|nr:mechanosensitive ion channel [Microbacterium halotolerans]